jgi:hypothetical protein
LCAPINSNNKKKKKKIPRAFDHPFVRHGPTISVLNLLIQLLSFFGPIDAQPKSAGKPDIFFFSFSNEKCWSNPKEVKARDVEINKN